MFTEIGGERGTGPATCHGPPLRASTTPTILTYR
ncbi:hypothetical protein E2C01_063009 [Portunus trituberculatus]|uniref:Uncharacterized protein n=1 Tax=Portunus trituberculatus TaxID=210409 RepID=A0A5B7HGD0_PORTR|nr:hypothetical protein [Portunus trituberculatus]